MEASRDGGGKRFGVLIVAHGDLAEVLARLVDKILGAAAGIQTVSVGWDDDVESSRRRVHEALEKAEKGRGVLVLTDMFGGTPTNVALPFLKEHNVEIITGVNLPMLVKIASVQDASGTLHEAADRLRDVGQRAIQLATHYLEKPGGRPAG